jgi:integrase
MGAFISFCSERGYLPGEISDGHFERFVQVLEAGSINPNWRHAVRDLWRAWNAAVDTVPGWPQVRLSVEGSKEPYCLPWDQLPPAFREDAEKLLAYLADPPLDDDAAPHKPLRPRTLDARRFDLRHLASVLLRREMPAEALNSVSDLLHPDALKVILDHFEPREDGTGRSRHFQIAVLLTTISKYWVKVDDATRARLKREVRRGGRKRRGMVKKNRQKIAYLKDDRVAARLLLLPPRLFAALERIEKPTEREANLALAAVYIELSIMCPLRVGNMSSIHMDRNIIRSGTGPKARVSLHFEAAEVKNEVDLECELPPTAVRFLNLYVKKYRPLLVHVPSMYLFPARNGGPRLPRTLWQTITKLTARYVGIAINPHLFRHAAAYFHLKARPGEYEVVRRTLGHRSMDTTTRSYAGAETDAAFRLFDDNILRLRAEAPNLLGGGRRRHARRTPVGSAKAIDPVNPGDCDSAPLSLVDGNVSDRI